MQSTLWLSILRFNKLFWWCIGLIQTEYNVHNVHVSIFIMNKHHENYKALPLTSFQLTKSKVMRTFFCPVKLSLCNDRTSVHNIWYALPMNELEMTRTCTNWLPCISVSTVSSRTCKRGKRGVKRASVTRGSRNPRHGKGKQYIVPQ
jgi:hypothetical protein